MDLSSSKKRKSETDLGRPPIRKNPTIGGVFRLFPEEFENNSLNVEKRTPNVNSLLKTASGLLQKKSTRLQNPSGQLPSGQRPGGQVTSGQITGKFVSEALIFQSVNPQCDERLFIESPKKYKFRTCCVQILF